MILCRQRASLCVCTNHASDSGMCAPDVYTVYINSDGQNKTQNINNVCVCRVFNLLTNIDVGLLGPMYQCKNFRLPAWFVELGSFASFRFNIYKIAISSGCILVIFIKTEQAEMTSLYLTELLCLI